MADTPVLKHRDLLDMFFVVVVVVVEKISWKLN